MVKKLAFLLSFSVSTWPRGLNGRHRVRPSTSSSPTEQRCRRAPHRRHGRHQRATRGDVLIEDAGTPSATDEQLVGLRYLIPVAKGASITKAYIEFARDETKDGTKPVNVIIEGQLAAIRRPSRPRRRTSRNRTRTTAQVKWTIAPEMT